jgi:hypothetical protein
MFEDRGPEHRSGTPTCRRFFFDLDPRAAEILKNVRFFTQMYWLESGSDLNDIFNSTRFQPTVLTITIRYSDWWFWEDNDPLSMSEDWLKCFNGNPGLRQLRVEYETLSWKKEEMMVIILRNKSWKLPIMREQCQGLIEYEGYLSADDTALREWTWEGPSRLDGQTWSHHGSGETIEYVVVTDTWNFVEGPMSETDALRRSDHISPPRLAHEDDPFYNSDDDDWDFNLQFMDGDGEDDVDSPDQDEEEEEMEEALGASDSA